MAFDSRLTLSVARPLAVGQQLLGHSLPSPKADDLLGYINESFGCFSGLNQHVAVFSRCHLFFLFSPDPWFPSFPTTCTHEGLLLDKIILISAKKNKILCQNGILAEKDPIFR